MRIARIEKDSLNNGPGVRLVVWTQGCSVHCKGCHNPETWNPDGGKLLTEDDVKDVINYLKTHSYVRGVTISGGNPLESYNLDYLVCLLMEIRKQCPDKDIWLYTGFDIPAEVFTEINDKISECLSLCDVVVDGPYIEALRTLTLPFRGSSNQRLIDVQKSFESKGVVLYETLC